MQNNDSPISALLALALLAFSSGGFSTTKEYIGSGLTWPTDAQWAVIDGANDPDDNVDPELEFVGDATDPMAYTYRDAAFVYFRMRLDVEQGGTGTFSDSHLILLDVDGQKWDASGQEPNGTVGGLIAGDDGYPDYGFAWDSKSNDATAHGLEMQVRGTTGALWSNAA